MALCITISIERKTGNVRCDANLPFKSYDGVDVFVLGTFYNQAGTVSSVDDIYNLYEKHGTRMYDHLDGVGTAFVVDQRKKKLYAFTDYFNSHIPLFYAENEESLVLTTDMLYLTGRMKGLSISLRAARQFMLHGMVYGKQTLIRQIYKLPPRHYLEVDTGRCRLYCRSCRYSFADFSAVTTAEYDAVFRKCMNECYRKDAVMTLSGGFDTNYIMHHLERIKQERGENGTIPSYCGGGSTGKDETPLVREMAERYGNVELQTFYVDRNTIRHYPEIVLALRGTCFEDGIFLHYQLAKLFQKDGVKYVYTGDLADQVLNLESFRYTMSTYKRMLKMSLLGLKNAILHGMYDYYRWIFRGRYEIGALKNLKKGGLLWDYFGAEGIYPYVRRQFLSMAQSVSVAGDYGKSFHRKAVTEIVDPIIARKIKRNGGNIDPLTLFDEQTKKILHTEIRKMPWFKERTFVDDDQQLGYELRILFVDLVRKIFIDHELGDFKAGACPLLEDLYPAFKDAMKNL